MVDASARDKQPHRIRLLATKPNWADNIHSGLWGQVKAELRSYFHKPYDVPTVIAINMLLALFAWFFINPDVVLRYTALVFLPVALIAWAFADVPSTNLFGSAPVQTLRYINEPENLRRMMTVKNIALWILVAPLCFVLSLCLLPSQHDTLISLAVCLAVVFLPFSYLGLAAVIAPLLPFHPMKWKERLKRRDTWLRYGLSIGVAYFALTGPATVLALGPAWLVFKFIGQEPIHVFLAAVILTPWAFILWRTGLHISTWIVAKRRQWLENFLNDPARG